MFRVTLVTIVTLMLSCSVSFTAPVPKEKPVQDKEKLMDELLGKWEMVPSDSTTPRGTVEFTKDKKVNISIDAGGMKLELTGVYEVLDKSTLLVTLTVGNETKGEKITIAELTREKLVTKDPRGKLEEFKRKQ
jgi:uncharacterized protein (TIGR03066 family)